jgi:hypothetical protein
MPSYPLVLMPFWLFFIQIEVFDKFMLKLFQTVSLNEITLKNYLVFRDVGNRTTGKSIGEIPWQ